MKSYNKLVRGKIPEIIEANGETPQVRVLTDDAEYIRALSKKLVEEAHEFEEAPSLEELIDNLEVAYSLGRALGYTPEQIESARAAKAQERGGFDERIFLISTE